MAHFLMEYVLHWNKHIFRKYSPFTFFNLSKHLRDFLTEHSMSFSTLRCQLVRSRWYVAIGTEINMKCGPEVWGSRGLRTYWRNRHTFKYKSLMVVAKSLSWFLKMAKGVLYIDTVSVILQTEKKNKKKAAQIKSITCNPLK